MTTYIRSYTAWADEPSTSTPITAAKLQNIDDGVAYTKGFVYDIRAYGAVATSGTDNSTAIQAAITAAEVTGGTVFVPADGTYEFATQLLVTKTCSFEGDATGGYFFDLSAARITGSMLKWTGGASAAIVVRPSTDLLTRPVVGVVIRNLTIDGNNLATQGIRYEAALQPVTSNVAIRDCVTDAVWLGGTSLSGYSGLNYTYGPSFQNIWVSQRSNSGNGFTFDGSSTTTSTLGVFANLQIAYQHGVAINLKRGDHHRFLGLNTSRAASASGNCIELGAVLIGEPSCNNNTFYGLYTASSVVSRGTPTNTQPATSNLMVGYSLADTATLPTVEAGSTLFWITDTGVTNLKSFTSSTLGVFSATPVAKQVFSASATDPASTQTLANSLRTALINLGFGS